MFRPLCDQFPKLLASLLSYGRDFGKCFLLGASPTMPPSSITNTQTEFQSGKKQLQTCHPYFCMVLLHFYLLLKPLLIPKLLLSPAASVFQCPPVPGSANSCPAPELFERERNQASELFLHPKQPLHGYKAGESPRKLLGGWRKERRDQDHCSKAVLRGRAEGVRGCCWVDPLGWFWGLALLHGCAFNLFQRCLEPYKSACIVRKRFSSQWILNSECNQNGENVLI